MAITLYNTLTKQKDIFKPLHPKKVLFYLCGVTVYDYCHIGHARAYVTFDCIRRYLEHSGYHVTFIQNFTDIDDKIITRSREKNIPFEALTKTFRDAYFEDMDQLTINRATAYPQATQYIANMITIIQDLIQKNVAYELNGHVFFRVRHFKDYGKLSHKILDDLIAGHRVDILEDKENPLDFVLWKPAKEHEPYWESPWGKGRPGWHIECSAMAIHELGPTIDIHAGGSDLIFPHHENEIAQSESHTGKPFANYWLHNGFVTIDKTKMSKSLGNSVTLRTIYEKYSGDVVRFYLMKAHYRAPLHFSFDGLEEAKQALDRLYTTIQNHPVSDSDSVSQKHDRILALQTKFFDAMDDDFNFAEAIGVLFELAKFINIHGFGTDVLVQLGHIIGLFHSKPATASPNNEAIITLIEERNMARQNKDYLKADKIRNSLMHDFNVVIDDTPTGTRWKKLNH